MPPHVARPARLLEAGLAERWRSSARVHVELACDGATHHLRFEGRMLYAADHDEVAEAALRALGGSDPACVRIVAAARAATPAQWWASLDPRAPAAPDVREALRSLPEHLRRTFLAATLAEEFADAAPAVRDVVAQLGLALLGDGPLPVDSLRTKFQLTRELPHWDPGPGPWSDTELVLLARCMRAAAGEGRPHLVLLPTDALAGRAVAKYVVTLLDETRFLTAADLRAALSPTHRNVKALTALLVRQGVLVEGDGQYRVQRPAPPPTAARATTRRRGKSR